MLTLGCFWKGCALPARPCASGTDHGKCSAITGACQMVGGGRESSRKLLLQHRDVGGEGSIRRAELGKLVTQRHSVEYTRPLGEV